MGYQVEYLLKLTPDAARHWLSRFKGFWVEPSAPGELPSGEFHLWDDQWLHADLGPTACWLRLPRVKYSWLIAAHPPALATVARFERLLAESLPGGEAVRVDELVREQWEAWAGRTWEELADPVGSLRAWLPSLEYGSDYFQFLPAEPRTAETSANTDPARDVGSPDS
jgi:hypothetical protein